MIRHQQKKPSTKLSSNLKKKRYPKHSSYPLSPKFKSEYGIYMTLGYIPINMGVLHTPW